MPGLDLGFKATLDLTEYKSGIEEAIRESNRLREMLNYEISLLFLDGDNLPMGGSNEVQGPVKNGGFGSSSGLSKSFGAMLSSFADTDKWKEKLATEGIKLGWDVAWSFLSDSVSLASQEGLKAGRAFGVMAKEYADSVNEFEENVNALKVSLGKELLPGLTAGFNLFNWLFGDRNPQLTAFKEASNEAQFNAEKARIAFEMLQNLGGDDQLLPSQKLAKNAIMNDMETLIPGFASLIDPKTGGFQAKNDWTDQEAYLSSISGQPAEELFDESLRTILEIKGKQAVNELNLQAAEKLHQLASAEYRRVHETRGSLENLRIGYTEQDETERRVAYYAIDREKGRYEEEKKTLSDDYETAIQNLSTSLGISEDEAKERIEAVIDASLEYNAALEEQLSIGERIAAIEAYRVELVDALRNNVEGLTNGFEAMAALPEKNIDDMLAGLASQQEFLGNYNDNLAELMKSDLNKDLLASLADGSRESAVYAQALMDALKNGVSFETINAQYQQTQTMKDTLAKTLADAQLIADDAYGDMVQDLDNMLEEFKKQDEARENMFATAQGLVEGLDAGYEGFAKSVNDYITKLNELAQAAQIEVSVSNIPRFESTQSDEVYGPPKPDGYNLDGLSYVPYNDYLSYLHKGEAVLTAAQADDWRAGRTGADISADAIASAVSGAVAKALSGLTVQMDGQTVGHLVAPTVSSDIAEGMITTRHYAVAW